MHGLGRGSKAAGFAVGCTIAVTVTSWRGDQARAPSKIRKFIRTVLNSATMSKTDSRPAIAPWLSIKNVPSKIYSRSTAGVAGSTLVKDMDYINQKWSLPLQFGEENYAYTLIDIDDPRYAEECAAMTQKLIHFYSDRQIISLEWRRNFRLLQETEAKRACLPEVAPAKTREMLDNKINEYKERLLEVQDQRDAYDLAVQKVLVRVGQIKAALKKERDLEKLRKTLTDRVKAKFSEEDPFWKKQFDPHSNEQPQIKISPPQ